MLIGTNLSKSYTGTSVFEGINFKIGNNKKVALVGKNGCGKSTLLIIIVGQTESNSGYINHENETIGYIPQQFTFPDEFIGEYFEKKLESTWDFYKVEKLVADLEFINFDPYQQLNTLSEGQKMKIKIIEMMLDNPTILLIDEPTNHLDIEGIMWFEKFINRINKTVLMISHDRQFLNNTVDEIWELENKTMLIFPGNYDNYKEEKLKLINKWDEEYIQFIKRKAHLEKLLVRARTMNISRKGGTGAVKSRIKREITQNSIDKYENKKISKIDFKTGITHTKLMVKFKNVSKVFNDNLIFNNLSFEIRGGEKVWLFGPNGSGKTTIVKLIMGETIPTSGEVIIGNNLKIGYFAQKQELELSQDNLLNFFINRTGCTYEESFGKLRKFMFEKDDLKKRVSLLSPGQRARFSFAIFAYNNYDMLILDEPDNHLDIDTKEILEDSLSNYSGTVLLISHDRFFVEKSGVNKILNLKNGFLKEY